MAEQLFTRSGVIRHADVWIRSCYGKGRIPGRAVLWHSLKKKKRFDAVILRRSVNASLLRSSLSVRRTALFSGAGETLYGMPDDRESFSGGLDEIPEFIRGQKRDQH